jgi:hypothetical protein
MIREKFKHYPPHVRFHAKELLAKGLSLKRVEKLTGVNRGTLSRVRRKIFKWPIKGGIEEIIFGGQTEGRCKTCGAKVYLPCVACQVRKKT